MNIEIRKAYPNEAEDITRVKALTWKTAYTGLISDEMIENRINHMTERIIKTENAIKEKNNIYVVLVDNKIVGTLSYGKSTNENYPDLGEIYSLYVLEEYHGLGLGKLLFFKGIESLIEMNYEDMILKVLKGNKTIHFYEKYGGKNVLEIQEYFDEILLTEYVMYFKNIKDIIKK